MLAACAPHARWVDVFCEPGSAHAFDGDEARAVLEAGRAAGLGLRVHANQLSAGPGVRLAVELGAASADHCTHLTDADVDALAGGTTVATLLPGVEFSTRSPYPDARRLLDAGRDRRAGHRLQPGQLLHLVDAVLHRARGPGDADDAGRGAVGGDRRRRGRAAPRPTSATWRPARGRTSPSSTRRPTGTWPTGPASPWFTRSNCPPDRGAVGRTRRAPGAGSAR